MSGFSNTEEQKRKHLSGVGIVCVCFISAITIAAVICSIVFEALDFGRDWNGRVFAIIGGVFLILLGIVLVVAYYISKGIYEASEDERSLSLITKGIYRWVRNPFYSGVLMINTGVLLIHGNFIFLFFPAIYWAFMTAMIKRTEEKWYKLRFAGEYDRYCDRVNRLIPWFPPAKSEIMNEYRKSTRIAVTGIAVSVVLVLMFSRSVSEISARITYEAALSMKKTILKESVDSTIAYIEELANDVKEKMKNSYLSGGTGTKYLGTEEEVEEYVEDMIRTKIYTETFSDGSYMWINKVLNYDGGENYAIRLIHPNLKETEGDPLSTETPNEMGMKAYEIELQGVKEKGSIYQNYAFKKLGSDEVTEKITYSRLYERFDWIVCMGVNIDNLKDYQIRVSDSILAYQRIILVASVATWVGFLFIAIYIYRRAHVGLYENKNRELRRKLNLDALTGAGSRFYGERELSNAFEDFKNGKRNTLILIADVDYFKQFNDTYGHDVGDKVLKSFADAIKKSTRSNDSVIRWGGDEFIVIMRDIPAMFQPEAADRILESIRSISIPELEGELRVTASMGFAYLSDVDVDAKATLSRADAALYKAKEAGRNCWKI